MTRRLPACVASVLLLLTAIGSTTGSTADASPAAVGAASTRHQANAKPKPKPRKATYLVTYTLKGKHYETTETPSDSQTECPGTGTSQTSTFSESSAAKVTVVLGKAHRVLGKPTAVKEGSLGDWSGEATVVYDGDDCGTTHQVSCGGSVIKTGGSSGDFLTVGTTSGRIGFQMGLTRVPEQQDTADDCQGDWTPVLGLGLYPALRPYDSVQTTLTWTSLKKIAKGRTKTFTAVITDKPHGYDPATCDGESGCSAVLNLVHTITIKRTA